MIVPGSANALLLASLAGYQIPYSLRFRAANSAYLRRTIGASSTSTTIATWSFWIKRGVFAAARQLIVYNGNAAGTGNTIQLEFTSGSAILAYFNGAGTTGFTTNAVFRDPSAWYHVVLAYDSTQATDSNRAKLYVNGTQISSFSSVTYPALNQAFNAGSGDYQQMMGFGATLNTDGYMAEVNFIDGQALTPSSFGQTDATTGVWVPKKYSGTYGTNGFYLKFADATSTTTIGNDSSGNANNFTTSGISVTSGVTFDQMTDTPTLNYATWNFLDKNTSGTMQNANLRWGVGTGVGYTPARATMAIPASGKWYFEITHTANGASPAIPVLGIASAAASLALNTTTSGEMRGIDQTNGNAVDGSTSTTYGAAGTAGNTYGVAIDMDAGTIKFSYNGDYANGSGSWNQTYGAGASAFTDLVSSGKTWFPYVYLIQSWADVNFGQRAFAYAPPTGFKALNTTNLPTPSIKKGSLYFDATLRTGTGASASVSSLGFQPDLVWIKSRSAATDHGLYDAVRGVQKQIESNTTTAETTETTGLTAFNSNGYTVGALAQLNTNTATYVDWAWKEGVTPGFDIVTYVGTGSALNVSHNLGVAPRFLVIKAMNNTVADNWGVYHGSLLNTQNLYLNLTNAVATAGMWNSTTPTSSVFTVGANNDVNRSGISYVGYVCSEIEGFSKFGSYTGNASADGPFVWCGFRPRYILFKNATSAGNNWLTFDTARNPYNLTQNKVAANAANSENDAAISGVSENNLDILSNGFKLRTSNAQNNGSGSTIIFAAFAENPFKYARAR